MTQPMDLRWFRTILRWFRGYPILTYVQTLFMTFLRWHSPQHSQNTLGGRPSDANIPGGHIQWIPCTGMASEVQFHHNCHNSTVQRSVVAIHQIHQAWSMDHLQKTLLRGKCGMTCRSKCGWRWLHENLHRNLHNGQAHDSTVRESSDHKAMKSSLSQRRVGQFVLVVTPWTSSREVI